MDITDPRTVKARKPHRCYWCGEIIKPGETYTTWTCFDGGDVCVVKVHPECAAAWRSLPGYDGEDVGMGDFGRGCTCEHGRCECEKPAPQAP